MFVGGEGLAARASRGVEVLQGLGRAGEKTATGLGDLLGGAGDGLASRLALRDERGSLGLGRDTRTPRQAAKSGDGFINLASEARTTHILDGEVRPNGSFGGGHRPGTGFPNKSEFPAGWSDEQIMHEISDVATDPSLIWRAGDKPGDFFVNGNRGGIDIEVLIRNNQIWTGYPTNVIRNAP